MKSKTAFILALTVIMTSCRHKRGFDCDHVEHMSYTVLKSFAPIHNVPATGEIDPEYVPKLCRCLLDSSAKGGGNNKFVQGTMKLKLTGPKEEIKVDLFIDSPDDGSMTIVQQRRNSNRFLQLGYGKRNPAFVKLLLKYFHDKYGS